MSGPSEWATRIARALWKQGGYQHPPTTADIAAALDAARLEGVRLGLEAGAKVCKERNIADGAVAGSYRQRGGLVQRRADGSQRDECRCAGKDDSRPRPAKVAEGKP